MSATGILIAQGIKAVGAAAPIVAAAVPGKMEKAYRDQVLADEKRLAGTGGGMSQGDVQREIATGLAGVQSQQEEALARVGRGSSGGGASGIRALQTGAIHKAGISGGDQVRSGVRQASLDKGTAERRELERRMLQAYTMGQVRKKAAMDAAGKVDIGGFIGAGEETRAGAAAKTGKTTQDLGAGSAADKLALGI